MKISPLAIAIVRERAKLILKHGPYGFIVFNRHDPLSVEWSHDPFQTGKDCFLELSLGQTNIIKLQTHLNNLNA